MYTHPSITSAPDLHLPVLAHIDGRAYDNNSHTSTPLTPPHDDKQDDDDNSRTTKTAERRQQHRTDDDPPAQSTPPLTPPCNDDRTMMTGPKSLVCFFFSYYINYFLDTSRRPQGKPKRRDTSFGSTRRLGVSCFFMLFNLQLTFFMYKQISLQLRHTTI